MMPYVVVLYIVIPTVGTAFLKDLQSPQYTYIAYHSISGAVAAKLIGSSQPTRIVNILYKFDFVSYKYSSIGLERADSESTQNNVTFAGRLTYSKLYSGRKTEKTRANCLNTGGYETRIVFV
jgi:hypothetical protein